MDPLDPNTPGIHMLGLVLDSSKRSPQPWCILHFWHRRLCTISNNLTCVKCQMSTTGDVWYGHTIPGCQVDPATIMPEHSSFPSLSSALSDYFRRRLSTVELVSRMLLITLT